ncbi:hypothetical protein BGZ59_004401, partial [Podila verticillata]
LSFGNVSNFQLSSGYKSSYAFGMIEQHVVNFLSDFNSHAVLVTMASCFSGATTASTGANPEAQEQQRKLIDLEFQYHYVVDQLVYYSTIKTGENFFQLASLLFCTLLGNRIFQIWSPAYLRDPRLAANGMSSSSSSSSGVGEKAANASGSITGSVNTVSGTTGTGSGGANGGIEENESMDRVLQTGSNGFTMMHHGHGRQSDGEEMIRVWPDSLKKWVEALDYFVSFFPYHTRQLETLKTLHHSLISS